MPTKEITNFGYVYNDGGRIGAGYKGTTNDCVTRAIAIATGKPYVEVYNGLISLASTMRQTKHVRKSHPRTGVPKKVYDAYLKFYGWHWTPTMHIGSGCKVHLRKDELPQGVIIARVSKHLVTCIDGVPHDNHDSSRGGTRCVYGYYSKA